jgi:hypothetical protein
LRHQSGQLHPLESSSPAKQCGQKVTTPFAAIHTTGTEVKHRLCRQREQCSQACYAGAAGWVPAAGKLLSRRLSGTARVMATATQLVGHRCCFCALTQGVFCSWAAAASVANGGHLCSAQGFCPPIVRSKLKNSLDRTTEAVGGDPACVAASQQLLGLCVARPQRWRATSRPGCI